MSTAKPRLDGVSGPATRSDVKCSTPTGAVPGCDAGLGTAVRFVAAELRDIWRSRRARRRPTRPRSGPSEPDTADVAQCGDRQIGTPGRPGL